MRKVSKTALMAAAVTGMLAAGAQAQQTWNVTEAIGSFNWHEDSNWTPGPYPNAVGAVANVNNDIATPMTISIPGGDGIAVGVLNLGDSGAAPDSKFTLGTAPGGAGTFVFDNGANDAQLNVVKDITDGSITEFDQLGTNLTLNSNLVIDAGPIFGSSVQIRGKISDGINGPRGLTINGTGFVELRQAGEANTFTGLTIVNSRLRLMSGGGVDLIAGDIEIRNGGVVQDGFGNGNVISDTSNINVVNGRYNPGGASDTIGSLEGGDTGSAGGGGGTVTFGANNLDKTYNGIFFSETSWIKTGTGVQTLGGPVASQVSDDSPATQHFSALGGRVDLTKPDGVTSIGQRNLFIGDGSQAGALRPELRLQASQQIQVHLSAGPTETTPVTLNSGILNLNGFSETVGSIVVAGSGTSTVQRANGLSMVNGLTVNETATLEVANDGSFNNVIKTPAVTIGATARIDLKDNKLLTDTPAGTFNGTNYTGIQGEVARAYNFGSWDQPGLMTSEPNASPSVGITTIGVASAEQILFIAPTETGTFAGQTVTGATTLAVYTYAGDLNFDGLVDAADYGVIDNFVQFPGTDGYANGDFNYDGVIDAGDYGIIDNTIQLQGAPIPMNGAVGAASGAGMSGVTAVPEPASLSVIGLAAAAMLGRRRRHSR
jgi:hypothetical protein